MKSGNGKKLLIWAAVTTPAIAVPAILTLVLILVFAVVVGGSLNDSVAIGAAQKTTSLSNDQIASFKEASSATGVPWEVLAAIVTTEAGGISNGGGRGGVTGFDGQSICPAPGTKSFDVAAPNPNPPKTGPVAGIPIPGPYTCLPNAVGLPSNMVAAVNSAGASGSTTSSPSSTPSASPSPTLPSPSASTAPTGSVANSGTPSTDYLGPFAIAHASWAKAHQPETYANNITVAGTYIGGLIASQIDNPKEFGAGALYGQDGNTIDTNDPNYKIAKNDYTKAIATLPIKDASPTFGAQVFDLAMNWLIGETSNGGRGTGGSGGMICDPAPGTNYTFDGPGGPVTLDAKQIGYATVIVKTALGTGMGQDAAVIALMTAAQESGLYHMYANSKVPQSLSYPHDLVGSDGLSVGLFQQQDGYGWGTVQKMMDGQTSTLYFLGKAPGAKKGLAFVPSWQSISKNDAAQAVQGSAVPNGYGQWESLSAQLLGKVAGISCTGMTGGIDPTGTPSGSSSVPSSSTPSASSSTPTGGTTGTPAVAVSGDQGKKIVAAAAKFIGMEYIFSGGDASGPTTGNNEPIAPPDHVGFDCSGLVKFAYAQAGISIPGHFTGIEADLVRSAGNWKTGVSDLVPGDMIFFDGAPVPGHVGIYIGNGLMIDSPQSGQPITVDNVGPGSYWASAFVGGGHP